MIKKFGLNKADCQNSISVFPHANKKGIKLYNMIFPIWLLWLIPIMWLIVLPANFLIDLTVIVLTMKYLGIDQIKVHVKKVILRVWLLGFAADFIGTFCMFLVNLINFDYQTPIGRWWYENLQNAVSYNPIENIYSFLWVVVCIAITSCCIYFLNLKFGLKKLELEERQKHKLALSLAVFTAPYLFLLPTAWFF
ncbi:MAG: hypothetical protein PWP51_2584 [Clostridiales bacterium]|jgi:hypothetical protein|nr:hypothetical protein [Clostridiales bacterium]